MGAEQSTPSSGGRFDALWAALPDDVKARVGELCSKESETLLKPNSAAPPPLPPVPLGVTVRLDPDVARAALSAVPRLQRKHYELIPKQLDEMSFWINFFTHFTVLVAEKNADLLDVDLGDEWKGVDGGDSFAAVWAELPEAKKGEVAALANKDNDALLLPSLASPPAFPKLPVGVANFVDENAAKSALGSVQGLQYKHYTLVPKKLDEKTFWVNFFTHATAKIA